MVTCIECIFCKIIETPTKKRYYQCLFNADEEKYAAYSPAYKVNCDHFFIKPYKPYTHKLEKKTAFEIILDGYPPFAKGVIRE